MVDSHGADGVRLSTRATMTDGATRCRLLLLEIDDLECHLRFPALRCACTAAEWLAFCAAAALAWPVVSICVCFVRMAGFAQTLPVRFVPK